MAKAPRWTGAAYRLRELKLERVTADYQLDAKVTQARAYQAVDNAKEIFKLLYKSIYTNTTLTILIEKQILFIIALLILCLFI
jgi:hypothetical protein